jgi:putative two-component system response regulator
MLKKISKKNASDLNESINKFGYLAEIHEWDNRKHIERIARYVFVMAVGMGFSDEEANVLSLASKLHDIGKIFTPKDLLRSTENLDEKDWTKIEKHTTQGAKVLESKDSIVMKTASIIALTHHERWDGSGYPQNLKGKEIPISGCICAVADVFDALTTSRPYKDIIADEEALTMIKDSGGVLLNPDVVAAFEKGFSEIRKIKKACE